MQVLVGLLAVSLAKSSWMENPRYGQGYVGGFQMPGSAPWQARCTPCNDRGLDSPNALDFRGNGADNLGYDWSPKAWGGPAFPAKAGDKSRRPDDDMDGRAGRKMPSWDEKCRECGSGRPNGWEGDRYTESPDDRYGGRDSRPDSWSASKERPKPWTGGSEVNKEAVATVTSTVLGVRLRDDKRLPVEWPGGGRSMRWDGFRNGMPWDRPDSTDRMDDFRPWDGTGRGVSGWDRGGKGHYASDWNYDSREQGGSGTKWNEDRPWMNSWNKNRNGGYSHGGGSLPFGSTNPNSDRAPSSSHRPSYPSNSWDSSTRPYPNKPSYNYQTSRPQSQYPQEIFSPRPGYPTTSRPPYETTLSHYPPPVSQQGGSPWNYQPERPGQWTTSRPSQNYLPQSSRPPTRPEYEYGGQRPNRPFEGTPGTSIWNGLPSSNDYRPGHSIKPSGGFYQGFITEIHDPNYGGGNRYPSDRPSNNGDGYNQNRPNNGYPTNDRTPDRYDNKPFSSSRPSYNNQFPTNTNRYPDPRPTGNDRPYGSEWDRKRYPGQDPKPSYTPDPPYDSDRNKYPNSNPYGDDRNRFPNYNTERDPNRRPSYDGDYNRRPSHGSSDRNPNYGSDRDPNYSNDRDRYPSYGSDRDSNRRPSIDANNRYPSRPGSSDYDRGPNPGSDGGSWNYGEDDHKDGTYRRSGGSYPSYKGGQYYTSSYLASASTPAASNHDFDNKKGGATDETTIASSQEK